MGELTVRRSRGPVMVRYGGLEKTEKAAGTGESRPAAGSTGLTVSETMRRLLSGAGQAESHVRESRRTLQVGQGVLSEVQDSLARMEELANLSASGGEMDRDALQAELDSLKETIDRMLQSASADGVRLFLDGDTGGEDDAEALLRAVMEGTSAGQGQVEQLPGWLPGALTQSPKSAAQLLAALGLDGTAGGEELLAALAGRTPESDPTAGYLAALYLGTVVGGSGNALEGLSELLKKVAEGVEPDRAVELLTNGAFTGLADFEEQFADGTAPGLQEFLVDLLLSGEELPAAADPSLLSALTELGGMDLELMMGLLDALGGAGTVDGGGAAAGPEGGELAALRFGDLRVTGRDLTGVSFDPVSNTLTLGGSGAVSVRGTGGGGAALVLSGSGAVTVQNVRAAAVAVEGDGAVLLSRGENRLEAVRLRPGAVLTLGGGGLLRLGDLEADESNVLRVTGGAVAVLPERNGGLPAGTLAAPVYLEGPASLAARVQTVYNSAGEELTPFELVWKTMLPGWSSIASVAVDGRQTRMALWNGEYPDPVRLWLERGVPSHGFTVHTVVVRGRDVFGRPQTRYAYLRWEQRTGTFQETSMYPNPFTVTGGEAGEDWVYEEESHTLRILSNRVTAISGGTGTSTGQVPFSGRVVLADGIGGLELSLKGVVCQVASGRAFDLGRENDVTLVLPCGTENRFESGAGCAGISLGDGTCVRVDGEAPHSGRDPAGRLTAAGGAGGAGIGRDSGGSGDRTSQILIEGGVITASGTGGGAGIGAGKRAAMGSITILGGRIESTGGTGGGAGIGGALGASVGDISIRGGRITACAADHAAAIGAGLRGACGDITITGTARIVKALGGNPGEDIGACLFGGCGKVFVSGGADIGRAKLCTGAGIPLKTAMGCVTLPQFRLSSRALQLERLCVSAREQARAAGLTVKAGRRWVAQIQTAYNALDSRLDRSLGGLYSFRDYVSEAGTQDTAALLREIKQLIRLQPSQALETHRKGEAEEVRPLLR